MCAETGMWEPCPPCTAAEECADLGLCKLAGWTEDDQAYYLHDLRTDYCRHCPSSPSPWSPEGDEFDSDECCGAWEELPEFQGGGPP